MLIAVGRPVGAAEVEAMDRPTSPYAKTRMMLRFQAIDAKSLPRTAGSIQASDRRYSDWSRKALRQESPSRSTMAIHITQMPDRPANQLQAHHYLSLLNNLNNTIRQPWL